MPEPTQTELESRERMGSQPDPGAAENLTEMAAMLRVFLRELQNYLSGVYLQLEREHKDSEAATVRVYADRIAEYLVIPYSAFIPRPDPEFVESVSETFRVDLSQPEANPQPDLKTLEGALYLLTPHELDQTRKSAVVTVNQNFETLLRNIWQNIMPGPGKTRAIHAINRARMECNAAISSYGA
jgi:hypothetical protein